MAKEFTGEKEKFTNKGNEKHEDADSLLCNTIHIQCLYQISKSSEKSLTKKKFANGQTNIVTEKTKTINPLYTLYARGINTLCMLSSCLEAIVCQVYDCRSYSWSQMLMAGQKC